MSTTQQAPLIHLQSILRKPWQKALFLLLGPFLTRFLGIRKINRVYAENQGKWDPDDFCKGVLQTLGLNYEIPEKDIEALKKIEGPIVMVSNHPFGGTDALIMMRILGKIRPDYKVFANYFLMHIPELRDRFLPVNPFDTPESIKDNLRSTKEGLAILRAGGCIGVFPAGEVSVLKYPGHKAKDKEWDVNISKIIRKTGATVIPLYFEGQNSPLFHFTGLLSMRLRTFLLIREFMNPVSSRVKFKIGKPIPPSKASEFQNDQSFIQYLQSKTYLLGFNLSHPKIRLRRILAITQKPVPDKIIAPVSPELLSKEIDALPESALLVQKGEMKVFQAEAKDLPQTLREIGRLREISFRATGEGSGKSVDLDIYDDYYIHLFVWNDEKKEIVGGYRIGKSDEILRRYGKSGLYTISLFRIKTELFDQIGPALEMGRSFVREEYQRNYLPLMLLWMGIGHFVSRNPIYRYLFGPVSITNDFHTASQSLLISFLKQNNINASLTNLVKPRKNFKGDKFVQHSEFYNAFSIQNLNDVQELISEIETQNLKVPILLKHYLKLGGSLLAFNVDPDFNNVVDGLIIVDLTKTEPKMLEKYMTREAMEDYLAYHQKTPSQLSPTR